PLLPRKPASAVSVDNTVIKGPRVSGDSAEMWQKSIEARGTPGTTWIGNIVSNGAEDSNHKSGKRDTIIFAPNTTDFSHPVELMYFFHGRAEFANNYDFKRRFAPALKRMSESGRNFVLVIPELPWCHHYKKIKGSTPINSSWRGNDNFGKFHNEVLGVIKETFSSKLKVGYTSITAHSQGGQALGEGLGDIIKIAPNKITLADSVGYYQGGKKNWAVELWDNYVKKNTDVELNVLVSVNGWLEVLSRRAEKTMKGSNVFFDYINKGGGPTGHRKIGDLGLEWVNQVAAKEKDAATAAAVKSAKANPVTNFDAEEPQAGATDATINPPQQPGAKAPLPTNPPSSPSATKKKQVGKKKLPVIQQAEPFTEARVKLKDYAALDGNSNLLVSVPSTGANQKLHKLAASRLHALNRAWMSDASEKGIPGAKPLKIASGWRKQSFKSKEQYEAKMIKEYGSVAEGRKWKAFESPHMTGLAMDIGNNGLTPRRSTNAQQKKTQLYTWLVENAHRFGFTPYKREAWHWEVRIPVESFKTGKEFTEDFAVRVTDPGTSDSDMSPQAATEP
ncbi:MAG TPA: D-alanyl-D-alanine carboxypeptidase family protein, partial [Clostridia bacterium]|nr:D-alanyl-D-alanine carboxypeptidase family protein [Clostridia bacterium]